MTTRAAGRLHGGASLTGPPGTSWLVLRHPTARRDLAIMPRLAAALAAKSAAAVPAGGPLIGRNSGQRLARHELAEMTFWQRIVNWLARLPVNAGSAPFPAAGSG